ERAAKLDPLLQTVGQLSDLNLADVLDLEKVDDLLDAVALFDLFRERRPDAQQLPEEPAAHLQRAPRHDVVERGHALEQRDVLEGARDAAHPRFGGPHRRARLALERYAALLRVIEAVDDVEHRRLARAVRANNGADLAFTDVERDAGHRLDAAEGERHVLDREQHVASNDVLLARR